MSTVIIPEGYQYVGAALLSTTWLLFYQVRIVSKLRRSSGIQYPQLYAEKAEAEASTEVMKFNCAQRAHQGTLENIPIIFTTTLIAGLKAPIFAASACVLWTLGRVTFTRGYVTGDPKKRGTTLYKLSYFGLAGLLLTSTYTAGEWLVSGISKAIL
ncbi:hypothetical protein AX17_000884 [Amanita inopinata Kibby_2008]|nr:hypothetical protein AX17_000884 [Amanita inopinata Kibby_2008]